MRRGLYGLFTSETHCMEHYQYLAKALRKY
jgi:hypothetical protein